MTRAKGNSSRESLVPLTVARLTNYTLSDYLFDLEHIGLEKVWDNICRFVADKFSSVPPFLHIKNFGELYEIGLAIQNKVHKKKSGQYYTPDDVATVMGEWLLSCEGGAVCDVACGTGKLIVTYLDLLGDKKAKKLLRSGNLYLYDIDPIALKICRTTLTVKYGSEVADSLNGCVCDFLDKTVKLPENCKVISNPPYARFDRIQDSWEQTDVVSETSELYAAFMEKIFEHARSSVIITPYSFISGKKFYPLRKRMCDLGRGWIVSFDNIPGNIFCGRKQGIFNTNRANSVRASITVLRKSGKKKGFRVSPLIRFKNEEREQLLRCSVLENTLPELEQVVDLQNDSFKKIDGKLLPFFFDWINRSQYQVKDFVSRNETDYLLDIPNTCRYYTVASGRKLNRTGSITLYAKNKDAFNFLYCMVNSSFAYWWWRVFDGGITYPVGLLYKMPLPFNLMSSEDKDYFEAMTGKLMREEKRFLVTKMNAGARQENIKFPEKYRNEINARILAILGHKLDGSLLERIHSNRFMCDVATP